MKQKSLWTIAFLLCSLPVFSQGVRWDLGAPGSAGAATTSGTGNSYLLSLPGVKLNWCNYPANAAPCTNFSTTYTDITLATACATNQPVVLQGSNTCRATGDFAGNLGVYTLSGTFSYTLTY